MINTIETKVKNLSQLDRIEYRIRRESILQGFNPVATIFRMACVIIGLTSFIFIIDLWLNMRTGNMLNNNLFLAIGTLSKYGMGFAILIDLFGVVIDIIKIRILNREYFGKEIKGRKNK